MYLCVYSDDDRTMRTYIIKLSDQRDLYLTRGVLSFEVIDANTQEKKFEM